MTRLNDEVEGLGPGFGTAAPSRPSNREQPPLRRPWRVLAVTSAAVFMCFLDVTIVNIAFPDLRRYFGDSSLATLSWVINGYGVVFAAALVPAGRLADRIGRRRLFRVGLTGFVMVSALCALAPTAELLVAARCLQALAAAMLVPTSLALLLPEFPLERRATATAIWGATGAVAAATGPALGGLLVAAADWRLIFVVNVPIGLGALVASRGVLAERRDPRQTASPDWWGAGLLAVGVAALALGIVQGPPWGWRSVEVTVSFGVAVLALGVFLRRCARHPAPVIDLGLFRIRSFAVANVGTVVFAIGFYALLLCNVLFLTGVWGWDIALAGIALTPGAVMAALLAPLAGRAADRFGQRAVAVPGALLFAGGAGYLALNATAAPDYVVDLLPGMLLTGSGIGLCISSFGSAAVAELPPSRFATGSAITACFRQIGAVVGIAVLLVVIAAPAPGDDPTGPFRTAWWVMVGTGLVSVGCALALGRVRAGERTLPPRPSAAGPDR